MNDNQLLFGEREHLLINSLNLHILRRHASYAMRQHVYLLIDCIRSIRGARTAYIEGLNHG